MLKFLLERPIAVLISYLGLMIFSVLAFFQLPISLLPSIDVPQIIIQVNAPNQSPQEIEQNVLRSIRENLLTLTNLKDILSTASNSTGRVALNFEYGTDMNLAYIEANEKIDNLTNTLPSNLERPKVIRLNTSDIPIVRIQVIPNNQQRNNRIQLSELVEKVLKKRLEALPGISLVDLNGLRKRMISITPNYSQMEALKITEDNLLNSIKENNQELGSISVKDGQYRYFVKLASYLNNVEEIEKVTIKNKEGQVIPLYQICTIRDNIQKVQGFHLFNGQEAFVINVHKQDQAKMTELMPLIQENIALFEQDYPYLTFSLTQDQSMLLDVGIQNLKTSLLWGGLFAFIILFFFMGDYRLSTIVGMSLPISLMISFLWFYFFSISINIISLGGLALGLGMLIDNSIVVLDNISRKNTEGLGLIESVIKGTSEVISPLISSVLTTLSVFVPLIFLNGLSGALFFDQALSVTIILVTSLGVAFTLLPLIYLLFFKKRRGYIKSETFLFQGVVYMYKWTFQKVFQYKIPSFLILLGMLPFTYVSFYWIETQGLPDIEKNETQVLIDWNEPIDVIENKKRVQKLLKANQEYLILSESDIGIPDYLLQNSEKSLGKVTMYLLCKNSTSKYQFEIHISKLLRQNYPQASFEITPAANAFDQLFLQNQPFFEIKLKNRQADEVLPPSRLNNLYDTLITLFPTYETTKSSGSLEETTVNIEINHYKLTLYQVGYEPLINQLKSLLGSLKVTELKRFGEITPIQINADDLDIFQKISTSRINNSEGTSYPLSEFIAYGFSTDYKSITADKTSIYHGIAINDIAAVSSTKPLLQSKFVQEQMLVDYAGHYFNDQENIRQLTYILMISILLLYFILSAQFESFIQPFIVILSLCFGITGALLFLKIGQSSLNIMSAIGLIVMLGIMVNDAILKIDTINRLKQTMNLKEAIFIAGKIRLKPILMTSITTILALIPVLFASGMGADLQKPLVLSVLGGLSVGTFTSLYFVPLFYYFISYSRKK